jgi:hypothetical protein
MLKRGNPASQMPTMLLSLDSHQSTTIISYLKMLTQVLAIPQSTHGTHGDVEMMLACHKRHNTTQECGEGSVKANGKAQPPNDNNTTDHFIDYNGENG